MLSYFERIEKKKYRNEVFNRGRAEVHGVVMKTGTSVYFSKSEMREHS